MTETCEPIYRLMANLQTTITNTTEYTRVQVQTRFEKKDV
jgi:hypothetical protein